MAKNDSADDPGIRPWPEWAFVRPLEQLHLGVTRAIQTKEIKLIHHMKDQAASIFEEYSWNASGREIRIVHAY